MKVSQKNIDACTDELMAWLKHCRDCVVAGVELRLDPFYERTALLTQDVVTAVLTGIVDYIQYEITKSPTYHANRQGCVETSLRTPAFLTLPYSQQLAIVQGIDRVCQPYRATDTDELFDSRTRLLRTLRRGSASSLLDG